MVHGSEAALRIAHTRQALLDDGIILCIRRPERDGVLEACRAAVKGGLRVLEITLTTPGALDLIRTLSDEADLLVGAGTVLGSEDVDAVAEAGGRFVLSPVCDIDVLDAAREGGLLAVPGAATPKEILSASRCGASLVKVFPSGALGGPAFLRAVRGPLGHIDMIPTSGPTSDTMDEWVAAGAAAVGVGPEVFCEGFTLASVETAARRIRAAMDRARMGAPAGNPSAST